MNRNELIQTIRARQSFLCIGLDSDIEKIPRHLMSEEDPVFAFNKAIIDATHDLAVAYKPNTAFYESRGSEGWKSLEKTIAYLKRQDNLFTIADAKRGDIGNSSKQYAIAFLGKMDFDAITLSPYMGKDSIAPFLEYKGKWVVLLALTSNPGAGDFQALRVGIDNDRVFEKVLQRSPEWGSTENMMYVAGATRADMLSYIRKYVPEHFLLVPGVGAQGGSLEEVVEHGITRDCGLIINASRSILYASDAGDFAEKARQEAEKLQKRMAALLRKHEIL
ncbi:MAG: orotidine-5'-phosphate decarboxylase [Bacteroidales bacterium]